MIDYGDFFKILIIFFLALISPGPDFMIVSSMSLAAGASTASKAPQEPLLASVFTC